MFVCLRIVVSFFKVNSALNDLQSSLDNITTFYQQPSHIKVTIISLALMILYRDKASLEESFVLDYWKNLWHIN